MKCSLFQDVDIYALYPSLADMEMDLPAFVAHRVKRLQAPHKLIEEIDTHHEQTEKLPAGKLKNLAFVNPVPQVTQVFVWLPINQSLCIKYIN